MILSGKSFGIFEPREKIFTYDGRLSPGMKCSLSELLEASDQFEPFAKIGASVTGDSGFGPKGHFPGTLFRFPLRQVPSELSKMIYTTEKVLKLFEAFMEESADVILFLGLCHKTYLLSLAIFFNNRLRSFYVSFHYRVFCPNGTNFSTGSNN